MRSRVLARLGALMLVAGFPLTGAMAAAAAPPIGAAAPASVGPLVVQSKAFDVTSTAEPKLLTSACNAGEELVAGGYTVLTANQPPATGPANVANNDAHVAFSYPSFGGGEPTTAGGRPSAWTVGVVNETRSVVRILVSAACLTSADSESSVALTTETHAENQFSLTSDCPPGTVRVGGGYRSEWSRSLGRAAITGSYPAPGQRWGVDATMIASDPDVRPRVAVTVFAVCLSGQVDVAQLSPATLSLTSGARVCAGGDQTFAATCTVSQSGSQKVGCTDGQVLTGGGYQVAAGAVPGNFSVIANSPGDGPAWTVAVNGTTPTTLAIRLRVTPLCLVERIADPGGGTTTPDSVDLTPAILTGAILVFLLLVLVALAVLALRRAARRRRVAAGPRGPGGAPGSPGQQPPAVPGLEIVVRAQRSSYRINGFRET